MVVQIGGVVWTLAACVKIGGTVSVAEKGCQILAKIILQIYTTNNITYKICTGTGPRPIGFIVSKGRDK